MSDAELGNFWRYSLSIARDLKETSQFVEPSSENFGTYSFEFAKIIMLACSEIDVICRLLCKSLEKEIKWDEDTDREGNIIKYAEVILAHYPKIIDSILHIDATKEEIRPFESWKTSKDLKSPEWWKNYNKIKHFRHSHFNDATLKNAIDATAALIILNLYLYMTISNRLPGGIPDFFDSDYFIVPLFCAPTKFPPDFDKKK